MVAIGSDEENNRVYKAMRDFEYKITCRDLLDETLIGVCLWTSGDSSIYVHWMSDYTPAPVP